MSERSENVLVRQVRNVPLKQDILKRKYINYKEFSNYVAEAGSIGITYTHIQNKFACNKKQAQRTLKYFHARGLLFTAKDLITQRLEMPPTFKNSHPQRYYSTLLRPSIIEKLKKDYRNALLTTTDTAYSAAPLSNCMEHQKGNYFLNFLQLLPYAIRFIHKMNIELSIPAEVYNELDPVSFPIRMRMEENIGNSHVTYRYHSNGKVQVFVACSKFPYKLEDNNDIANLYSVFGRIKDRISSHLFDPKDRIVPPIDRWILKQCDVNVDFDIGSQAQIYLPDIQLKSAGHVFRMYVKSLQEKTVYRIEHSKELDSILMSSLRGIAHPWKDVEFKVDMLLNQLKDISSKIANTRASNFLSSPLFLTIF
jgi:hypothetical protein